MNPQSFSSIFEILATLTLAYIIIDELTENPFISIVSEKVLKKYAVVERIFGNIETSITGTKTSLNNLAQVKRPVKTNDKDTIRADDKEKKKAIKQIFKAAAKELPRIQFAIGALEERVAQSYAEIRAKIRANHSTKVFVYSNCYLFFYCLAMLFYGGLYSSNEDGKHIAYNLNLDYSLFIFNTGTIIILVIGWFLDKQDSSTSEIDKKNKWPYFINGYFLVIIMLGIISFLAVLAFYYSWEIINFENGYLHRILIITSLLLPLSNFFIYIIKASKRANKILPQLINMAKAFEKDYLAELEEIDNYIGMFNYMKGSEVKVE